MDTHEVKGTLKEMEGSAEKGYGRFRERAGRAVDEWSGRLQDRTESSWEGTREWIRSYPGRSIGIALGVGFVIGALWRMRD